MSQTAATIAFPFRCLLFSSCQKPSITALQKYIVWVILLAKTPHKQCRQYNKTPLRVVHQHWIAIPRMGERRIWRQWRLTTPESVRLKVRKEITAIFLSEFTYFGNKKWFIRCHIAFLFYWKTFSVPLYDIVIIFLCPTCHTCRTMLYASDSPSWVTCVLRINSLSHPSNLCVQRISDSPF